MIAQDLTRFMNEWIGVARSRVPSAEETPVTAIAPADLDLPVLTFAARLHQALGAAAEKNLARAHQALLRDMTLQPARGEASPTLVVERLDAGRSFASAMPSGGDGPVEFEAGKHKGQLAIIAASGTPAAAYTMFTRDPAPIGKRLWDLSWGEAVLWLASPSQPKLSDGRLLLMPSWSRSAR